MSSQFPQRSYYMPHNHQPPVLQGHLNYNSHVGQFQNPYLQQIPQRGSGHPMEFMGYPQHPEFFSPQVQTLNSPTSVVETKYFLKKNGPVGSSSQANAAANYYAKSGQQRPTNRHNGGRSNSVEENNSSEERIQFPTNFRTLVHRSPPPVPHILLRKLEETSSNSGGKIRILLRVNRTSAFDIEDENNRYCYVDKRRRQITLFDPSKGSDVTVEERGIGVAAPKMFAFDSVFTSDDQQEDVCAASLCDVIASVVANGNDGCVFCYGHANTGKSRTMIGSDNRSIDMGVIPVSIAWLYRAVKERKNRTGARFSVRVSAMEISSRSDQPRDLLNDFATAEDNDRPPAYYLRGTSREWILNQTELRASSADKAAYYLDAALSNRSADARGRESHFLFTMHVYQYSVDGKKGALTGGRSRLHLIDFGGCERTRLPGGGITLSGLGNVILGIFNGQKHLPHRESIVTKALKDCLGSSSCQAAIIAHASPEPAHYSETLHTVQLSSRLHRMKRRTQKRGSSSSSSRSRRSGSSSGHSSSDFTGTGTSTNASSSEFSCDTVVYRGGHSDGSGTDGEHPPSMIMIRGGSLDHFPVRRPRSSKILTNGAISPRNCLSPVQRARPGSSLSGGLPAIPEVISGGKMPLSGLVPIQTSHRLRQKSANQLNNYPQMSTVPAHLENDSLHGNKSKRGYGYMDEHKVNMIHTWVENASSNVNDVTTQDSEPVFRALTQFKTADSDDSGSEHKVVQVHQTEEPVIESSKNEEENVVPKKKQPPPPPPRRTPPRDTKDSQEISKEECIPTAETSWHVGKTDDCETTGGYILHQNESSRLEEHPLRILSEENLTCVSSFAGSVQKLDEDNDREDFDAIDPSRLSFFGVPDFTRDEDFIKKNFELLAQMQEEAKPETDVNEPHGNTEILLTFPRNQISSSAPEPVSMEDHKDLNHFSGEDQMTPQKNFLLLSQSLRHPDGSSNPELNHPLEVKPPQRTTGIASFGSEEYLAPPETVNENKNDDEPTKSKRFAFRFLKIFSSTRNKVRGNKSEELKRSKSCDRKLEDAQKMNKKHQRSSSASPAIKPSNKLSIFKHKLPQSKDQDQGMVDLEMPSTLSLETEWEFNKNELPRLQRSTQVTNFDHILIEPRPRSKHLLAPKTMTNKVGDRKSSGYDSLGNEESSSLDSSQDSHQSPLLSKQPPMGRISEVESDGDSYYQNKYNNNMNRSNSNNNNSPNGNTSSFESQMGIVQYEEVDILRMEQLRTWQTIRQQQEKKNFSSFSQI